MDLQEAEDMLHTFWVIKANNVIGNGYNGNGNGLAM